MAWGVIWREPQSFTVSLRTVVVAALAVETFVNECTAAAEPATADNVSVCTGQCHKNA